MPGCLASGRPAAQPSSYGSLPSRRPGSAVSFSTRNRTHRHRIHCPGNRRSCVRTHARKGPWAKPAPAREPYLLGNFVDYYAVLQVDDDADSIAIKLAYRNLAKVCHPDTAGQRGHNMCILLNEACAYPPATASGCFSACDANRCCKERAVAKPNMQTRYDCQVFQSDAVLMSPEARQAYNAHLEVALADDADGYTGEILSKWIPTVQPSMAKNDNPLESRGVFVDELSCIGCKNCTWCASATFRMEELHGRSRVFAQWINDEDTIQQAIDSCPVDCIHWVYKDQLPALEYVCQQKLGRANIAAMITNPGLCTDVFAATEKFLKERTKLEAARKVAQAKGNPMQEAARRAAAEELAREQSGWLGQMSYRMSEGMKDMAGSYESSVSSSSGASNGSSEDDGTRVGRRKRPPPVDYSEQEYADNIGGTIPRDLSMVMSRDEGDW